MDGNVFHAKCIGTQPQSGFMSVVLSQLDLDCTECQRDDSDFRLRLYGDALNTNVMVFNE